MPCSPNKRSTRMARGKNPTTSGQPPTNQTPKTASPPLPPLAGRFTRTNLRFDPFQANGHRKAGPEPDWPALPEWGRARPRL
jgi:hypothetical protein